MKVSRFLTILILVLSTSFVSFGQALAKTAVSEANISAANKTGIYIFTIPNTITANDVALSAEYYTMYFSVNFKEKNHQTVISMKDASETSKHIIGRFFMSLGLSEIQYEGTNYPVEEFYQKFLSTK